MAETPAADLTVAGSSADGFAAAVDAAVERAARTIQGIRAAEVVSLRTVVEHDRVVEYVAVVRLSL